jgi:hypothetical protein
LHKNHVLTPDLKLRIKLGTFQKLCLALKFSFKPPDSIPLLQSEVTYYLNLTVVVWIGSGGTIAWPPLSHDLTPLDFPVCGDMTKTKFLFHLFLQEELPG